MESQFSSIKSKLKLDHKRSSSMNSTKSHKSTKTAHSRSSSATSNESKLFTISTSRKSSTVSNASVTTKSSTSSRKSSTVGNTKVTPNNSPLLGTNPRFQSTPSTANMVDDLIDCSCKDCKHHCHSDHHHTHPTHFHTTGHTHPKPNTVYRQQALRHSDNSIDSVDKFANNILDLVHRNKREVKWNI